MNKHIFNHKPTLFHYIMKIMKIKVEVKKMPAMVSQAKDTFIHEEKIHYSPPNKATYQALKDLEYKKGNTFDSIGDLFDDLDS